MKVLSILPTLILTATGLAAPQIQITATISGAPAIEAAAATAQPVSAEFKLPSITTRPEQKAVIELIREVRYPTAGGATPKEFETRNRGTTLEITPHVAADGLITFDCRLHVVRVANKVEPSQNPHALTATTFITRETIFTGRSRSGELVTVNLGETGRDFGQLKITLKLLDQ